MDTHQLSPTVHPTLDDYLSRLLDSSVIGIVCTDVEGKVLDANRAFLDMLGHTLQDLKTGLLRWDQMTAPESMAVSRRAIEQLQKTGYAAPFQKEYLHKLGHRVPVTFGALALDEGSKHYIAYIVDHSEHQEMLKLLGESQERFQMLTEAIPQMVWTATELGKVDYANKRFTDYTGVSATDNDGFSWQQVVHPEDLPALLQAGKNSSVNGVDFEVEARYRSKAGEYRWQLIRALPMELSDGTTKWFGTCTDIDDQKRVEVELREAEARLRSLAEAIPQIVWTAEPSGAINSFNQRWFEYTGLSLEQSLSGGWQLLLHPDDRQEYLSEWQKVLVTGDSFECRFRLKRAVGVRAPADGYRHHLCRAVSLRNSAGDLIEWFGTWTDIHDQR